MNIQGLQKLTLLDYPGKLACTIFTAPCNLRCPFCHNSSLITGINPELAWEEIKDFLLSRQGVLQGVCITGGEPTLHPNLADYLREIKTLGFLVKLDTNGTKPEVVKKLVETNLVDYVALDVKNCPERYGETVGIDNYNLTPISQTIEYLLNDQVEYEFRTTVVRQFHTSQDLAKLANWIRGTKRYFLQSFVDSEEVLQRGLHPYSSEEMYSLLESVRPIIPGVELRGT